MTGQPGRSGGVRTGAGRPPGDGNPPGIGRPKGATDVTLSPARLLSPGQKWQFAEKALQYAQEALEGLVIRNLRLKTDASGDGPEKNAPALVRAGMVGDRADVIFADPSEISPFISTKC